MMDCPRPSLIVVQYRAGLEIRVREEWYPVSDNDDRQRIENAERVMK